MQAMKRWQWIMGVGLLSLALAACGGVRADTRPSGAPSGPAQQGSAGSAGTTVQGVATNFAFALDQTQVSAGPVTFVITNDSPAAHDFAIEGRGAKGKTAMIQPGQSATLTLDLAPGTYTYVCTIPGHEMLGMKGVLTVN